MRRFLTILMATGLMLVAGSAATSAASSTTPSLASTHVYLIIGENTELGQVNKSDAPYLTGTLKLQSAWLTNYFALTHFSEANYVGMMSGQFTRCEQQDYGVSCHQDVAKSFQAAAALTPPEGEHPVEPS